MTLRERLDWMQEVPTLQECLQRLELITQEFPNAVCRLEEPEALDADYSCLAYALGLAGEPTYEAVCRLNYNAARACGLFVEWLFKHGRLRQLALEEATSGDLVWYRGDGRFKHVGVVTEAGRVRSKFGQGLLFEHDSWAVPMSYGTELWYSPPLPAAEALECFLQYAAERGIVWNSDGSLASPHSGAGPDRSSG
jgi:hypothetical protein